jgi:hypothetical protein
MTGIAPFQCQQLPSDLCLAAIKAARRLQALPNGRFYIIMLFKRGDDGEWLLSIPDDSGYKVEIIKAGM